jgi:hypothetical protein
MWLNRLKRNDKIGLFFFTAFVISSSLIWLFEERFNEDQWASNPSQRYKMVDDLIESQILINRSKAEVKNILGEPSSQSNDDRDIFVYNIGKQPSFFENRREHLLIIFELQRVDEVTLAFE